MDSVEEPIIIRNDDVCSNTDVKELVEIYDIIKTYVPNCRIINGISVLSKRTNRGSVYDEVPFKNNPIKWFYDIDQFIDRDFLDRIPYKWASHGLVHVDHTRISRDAQQMSIVTSCSYLGTNLFIPPFGKWNEDTQWVCDNAGLKLIKQEEWKSFEFQPFDSSHKKWYFHSWRYTKQSIRKVFDGNSTDMAKLRDSVKEGVIAS